MLRGRTLGFGSARLLLPLPRSGCSFLCCQSGNPERLDAHCAPRSYGDGGDAGSVDGPADGGGVRRGFSVGDGSGVGVGVGVGSAVADGDGSTVGVGVALGSGVGVGVGDGVADGSRETVGSAVGTGVAGSGVAETTELGRGVDIVEGSAVWAAGTEVVGVATGSRVARPPLPLNTGTTNCEAANTNAPPSRATVMIVRTRVPVVRMAPRRTWVRRSDSHE